jgi:hypothetical protein
MALLLVSAGITAQSKTIRFSGNVRDTSSQQQVQSVVMMAVRFSDSTLAGYSRSDRKGLFKPFVAPRDTYIVIFSHSRFSDKTYLIVPEAADSVFNFRNVVLPPKDQQLKEVEIIAYREKSYYKGDTLVFVADSFATRANASVEDLLKKLPGFRVDQAGKITIQGTQVDQVLVDGDEFFGTDPTVATRNLNASSIQNVQVFDKKNESTGEDQKETLKVINLQMKEDAKKGYFGKASGAGDMQKFYEGELLANKFRGKRKLSAFGLAANTPRQAFSHADAERFGLSNEQQWQYDSDNDTWMSNRNDRKGIPQTLRGGFYFNDKFGKTKVNADYTYNQSELITGTETNTQLFLEDTTFTNRKINTSTALNSSHALNARIAPKLDSLTELVIAPKVRYNLSDNMNVQADDFISESLVTTRTTSLTSASHSDNSDMNIMLRLNRNFRKKDRVLVVSYQPVQSSFSSRSTLTSIFRYYTSDLADSVLQQRRSQENHRNEHNTSVTYTEPFNEKLKTEVSYVFNHVENGSNRVTYDLSAAGGDIINPSLSNNFDNLRISQRAGVRLIYEVKTIRFTAGSAFRNIKQENTNVSTGLVLRQNVDNILPNGSFQYRFNPGSRLSLNYNTNSQLPDLQQMQPVRDVSDPNRIREGNPDLRPTFSNNLNLNYYFHKGISDVHLWSGANCGNTLRQFSDSTFYDSLGRAVIRPVNVNGNYHANSWLGGGFPLFGRFLKVYPRMNTGFSNNVSYVNGVRNDVQNISYGPGLSIEKETKDYEVEFEGHYDHNIPSSSLSRSAQQPYYTFGITGDVMVKLPGKFQVKADGNYVNNGNRTPGYNLNYFILNASVEKSFMKTENLVVSVIGTDILNQNISNERFITSNQIVDRKIQVIRRYFLLKVMFKFNSQTKKEEGEDD